MRVRRQGRGLAFAAMLALAAHDAGAHDAGAQDAGAQAVPAQAAGAARPAPALEALTKRASCLIEANSVIKLAAATQGTIARMAVERGDSLKAGDIVAQLESEVEQTMLEAAELRSNSEATIKGRKAELVLATGKLARVRELAKRTVTSQQALDTAIAEAEVATQAYEQAKFERELAAVEARRMRATIERRVVRSPVTGVVTKVEQRVGEFADPAKPLAEIAENHVLRVEVYLPVEAYPLVSPGMTAEIQVQEPIRVVRLAKVQTKDAQIDAASSLFQLSLRLENGARDIPAGLRCAIRFVEAEAK